MKNNSRHILFVCSRLDLPGGTERSIVNTVNLFASKKNKVTLLILDESPKSFFPIADSVSIYHYDLHFGITEKGNTISRKIAFFSHLRVLKKKLKQLSPQVIITTEYHFTVAAGLVVNQKKVPVYSWEHHHFHWLKRNRFWQMLHKKMYARIAKVITLNETERRLFQDYGCKAAVIPNFTSRQTRANLISPRLLTVGWLNHRKGVDMIPSIGEKIFLRYPDWHWQIIGSGDMKEELKKSIIQKKLEKNIRITEPVSNDLSEEYRAASIYVMTSRFECFPMVLLEAMSYGIPCVSFECATGPSDIIQNRIDGFLVENQNVDAMSAAILQLIENEEKRKAAGVNAFKNIERFSPEHIYQLWENLFESNGKG